MGVLSHYSSRRGIRYNKSKNLLDNFWITSILIHDSSLVLWRGYKQPKGKETMKKFTKMFVGVFCALLLVTSAFAADKAVSAANSPVAVETVKATSLFNAGEVGLSLSTGYDVGAANAVKGSTLFNQPYNFNLTAGAFYFPWRNVGLEANVPFYQTKGVSVDEVQAGLLFRLPLSSDKVILKNVAPYVGLGGVYNWNNAQDWAYVAKVGTEVRLNKKWGVFAEGQYRNHEFQNWGQGAVSVQGGLRLVF